MLHLIFDISVLIFLNEYCTFATFILHLISGIIDL